MIRDESTGALLCGWRTPGKGDGFCRQRAVMLANELPVCEEHAALATAHCVCFFCSERRPGVPVYVEDLCEEAQHVVLAREASTERPCLTTNHRVGCCAEHRSLYHLYPRKASGR